MKAKTNKALWIPRGFIIVACSIISYYGLYLNDDHVEAVVPIVLIILLILGLILLLSFKFPLVSAILFLLISGSYLLFTRSIPMGAYDVLGIDAAVLSMWLILIGSILMLILSIGNNKKNKKNKIQINGDNTFQ